MATRNVRVCDRCAKQVDHFNSTDWSVVAITLPEFQGKVNETKFDLCGQCTSAIKMFINTAPQQAVKTA
jgi:hypothetical protein